MGLGFNRLGRGGRSFLREVAIIIVGVLIALALEQLVSGWRERQRTEDIRASMNEEIADFANVLQIRIAAGPCILAKLDAIDAWLARAGAAGPLRNVGRAPFYFSSRGAWNADAADQLARHLGPPTFRIYGETYQGMAEFAAISQREQDFWIVLQTLERQDEPVAGERRWRLIEASAGARNANLLLSAIAQQMLGHAQTLRITPNTDLQPSAVRERPLCLPLETGDG